MSIDLPLNLLKHPAGWIQSLFEYDLLLCLGVVQVTEKVSSSLLNFSTRFILKKYLGTWDLEWAQYTYGRRVSKKQLLPAGNLHVNECVSIRTAYHIACDIHGRENVSVLFGAKGN
eukprot:TRINITY_DN1329_c1_g1_i1.p2 TRINITY_DN1329_c1_g1~~TRINITY_DN1329_c1_g1_i1.p2  ORF type:complete len:116 (+),score=7.26 TRINITY_DN1329_c1_g1_i1:438-785(+)